MEIERKKKWKNYQQKNTMNNKKKILKKYSINQLKTLYLKTK